jgi:two-component system, chemotaxis family, response regulator Rcp1
MRRPILVTAPQCGPVQRILLVEDNPGDAQLVRMAFAEALPSARVSVATDGEAALTRLRQDPSHPPDLLLLDLNLPRLSGHEVLEAIKADAALRRLPVVVLSSSEAEADVTRSYELGASSHIAKPGDVDALFALVETLARYWFGAVTLPGGTAARR